MMKSRMALAVILGCAVTTVSAQSPSSAFDRGNSRQSWQEPELVKKADTPLVLALPAPAPVFGRTFTSPGPTGCPFEQFGEVYNSCPKIS
jgi:hypothetical protein